MKKNSAEWCGAVWLIEQHQMTVCHIANICHAVLIISSQDISHPRAA